MRIGYSVAYLPGVLEKNAYGPAFSMNEGYASLLERSGHAGEIVRNRHVRATFEISNGLPRDVRRLCKRRLTPPQHCPRGAALFHRQYTAIQGKLSD
jgi:hypothetical protein